MFREKFLETDVKRDALIKEIAEFLRKVLPKNQFTSSGIS